MNQQDTTSPPRGKRRARIEGSQSPELARIVELKPDGWIVVDDETGPYFACLWLQASESAGLRLQVDDRVLVLKPSGLRPGVVLGRVVPYRAAEREVTLEATESLRLQCGASSLTLQADGKVLLKGEDVVLRAKGTQRIRAGNVAIN